jgi:PPOX class probable F420-dependent enzyme
MLSGDQRSFLVRRRIGHLATADGDGMPHLVPVCFALGETALYTPIDEKPKSGGTLKRLSNIRENPRASFLADHYDEDWSQLGWLRIDGPAELLFGGPEFDDAIRLLKARYAQYRTMRLFCIIAIRFNRVISWGRLSA